MVIHTVIKLINNRLHTLGIHTSIIQSYRSYSSLYLGSVAHKAMAVPTEIIVSVATFAAYNSVRVG